MSSDLIEASRGVRAPVEEAPVVRPSVRRSRPRWAVMLAGGHGGESLLAQTRARLESLFHVDRELFVVTRAHETYYREELRNVDDSRIIPQPLNHGTGVAVAVALLHILQRDADPVVVFVPCDHYYSDAEAFSRAIRSALSCAEQYPDSIVVLGAEAHYAEVDYGWTERGSAISHAPIPLLRVDQFWEKPSLPQARALLHRGCLWNTFVTVGHASTFLDLLCAQIPNVVLSIRQALAEKALEAAYRLMPAVDLSGQVLSPQPHRLLTVPDTASGWADLGCATGTASHCLLPPIDIRRAGITPGKISQPLL